MKYILNLTVILSLFYSTILKSEIINQVTISGNNRISNNTIINLIQFEKNKDYTLENLNDFQKKLLESNFFENAKLKIDNKNLIITVKENPIIDFFYIDGVQNGQREELIYEKIQLGQNKIFSESILKNDIEKIKEIYLESGYFNVNVIPRVSKLKNNSLNVILEVKRDEKYKIKRIYFIGNKFFNSSTLSNVVSSSEHGWWKFLSSSSTANQKRLDYDQRLLKNFYLNEGFIDVQIVSANIDILDSEYASLTYSINSGEKYFFSSFKISDEENNLTKPDKNYLELLLKDKLKGNYSLLVLDNLREKIYDYLNNKRIEFVKFDIRTDVLNNNKVNLVFDFKKTDRRFINLINVKGNSITEEQVIRRNLVFAEGDTFANYKLEKSKDNLKDTGIFKEVETNIKNISNELVDLEIDVEEQPTGSLSAGVGIGSAESSVSTGIQERNLFGKGINLNSNLSLGTEKISGIVSVELPDYKFSGNQIGYDFYVRSVDYANSGYESTVAGNSASIKYNLFENLSLETGAGIERDKITTSSTASALYKSRKGNYMTYKGYYNIENDKRNRKFKPTDGHKVGFGQTLGIPGSDVSYLSNDLYGSYYNSLSKEYVLNFKGGLSSVNALNNKDVKLSDRKFLNQNKLRGFENFGIGPKDGKDHVGGNYSAYASVTSSVPNPLPEKWNADSYLFIDTGNVWGVDYDSSKDSDKIRSSFGVSLDWTSPLGPLSFTLAETISSAAGDKEESFSFKIGSSF